MTGEQEKRLSEALAPIGWERAELVAPWRAARLRATLTSAGGKLNGKRGALERHESLMAAVATTVEALGDLSDAERTALDLASTPHGLLDDGSLPAVDAAIRALDCLIPGLISLAETHRHEAPYGKRNDAAYRVAEALAEIYVIGRGKRPGASRNSVDGGPSGHFPKVVAAVFEILGIEVRDIYPQCRAARDALSDERFAELCLIHRLGEVRALDLRRRVFQQI